MRGIRIFSVAFPDEVFEYGVAFIGVRPPSVMWQLSGLTSGIGVSPYGAHMGSTSIFASFRTGRAFSVHERFKTMSYTTVICSTCSREVKYRFHNSHDEACTSDDHSDIGLVEPDDEERTPTGKHGKDLGKRTNPECDVCRQDVEESEYKDHVVECSRQPEPSDIGVVDD